MKKNKEYIRVGDTVRMIFTDETGIVLSYLDAETLSVEIDGEDIPVFSEHLEKVAEIKPSSITSNTSNKFPQSPNTKKKTYKKGRNAKKEGGCNG